MGWQLVDHKLKGCQSSNAFSLLHTGCAAKVYPTLNILSTRSFYNLWHLEKFWASFDGILYLEYIGVVATLAFHFLPKRDKSCISQKIKK